MIIYINYWYKKLTIDYILTFYEINNYFFILTDIGITKLSQLKRELKEYLACNWKILFSLCEKLFRSIQSEHIYIEV